PDTPCAVSRAREFPGDMAHTMWPRDSLIELFPSSRTILLMSHWQLAAGFAIPPAANYSKHSLQHRVRYQQPVKYLSSWLRRSSYNSNLPGPQQASEQLTWRQFVLWSKEFSLRLVFLRAYFFLPNLKDSRITGASPLTPRSSTDVNSGA